MWEAGLAWPAVPLLLRAISQNISNVTTAERYFRIQEKNKQYINEFALVGGIRIQDVGVA